MLDKSQCKLEYWGSVGLHGLKGDCKAYRNDFSSISAAPSKWWKWKWWKWKPAWESGKWLRENASELKTPSSR